jgi:membrane-bound metal-dependent hydrolase YbcI (DUF457 family)
VFVGHALLAFALAVLVADRRGWPARRALALGVVAGAFAAVPDVDVAYAALAIDFGSLTADSLLRPSTFWDATRDVHRTVTHSLVVALVAGPVFGLCAASGRARRARRAGAVVALGALVAVTYAVSGPVGGVVMVLFAVAGLGVASLARLLTDLSMRTVAIAATAGLATHPWGDLLTGGPPPLLYPLDVAVLESRVVLHADPTVHLLGAFAFELAMVWLAALALVRLYDRPWRALLDRRGTVGAAYGVAAVVMAPPTLAVSYHFVFSILSVGFVCGGLSAGLAGVSVSPPIAWRRFVPRLSTTRSGSDDRVRARTDRPIAVLSDRPAQERLTALVGVAPTVLTAITAALVGYTTVYVVTLAVGV